jgi:hypothetical protein
VASGRIDQFEGKDGIVSSDARGAMAPSSSSSSDSDVIESDVEFEFDSSPTAEAPSDARDDRSPPLASWLRRSVTTGGGGVSVTTTGDDGDVASVPAPARRAASTSTPPPPSSPGIEDTSYGDDAFEEEDVPSEASSGAGDDDDDDDDSRAKSYADDDFESDADLSFCGGVASAGPTPTPRERTPKTIPAPTTPPTATAARDERGAPRREETREKTDSSRPHRFDAHPSRLAALVARARDIAARDASGDPGKAYPPPPIVVSELVVAKLRAECLSHAQRATTRRLAKEVKKLRAERRRRAAPEAARRAYIARACRRVQASEGERRYAREVEKKEKRDDDDDDDDDGALRRKEKAEEDADAKRRWEESEAAAVGAARRTPREPWARDASTELQREWDEQEEHAALKRELARAAAGAEAGPGPRVGTLGAGRVALMRRLRSSLHTRADAAAAFDDDAPEPPQSWSALRVPGGVGMEVGEGDAGVEHELLRNSAELRRLAEGVLGRGG